MIWATTPHRAELLLSCDIVSEEHAYALEAVLKVELEHNTATPAQSGHPLPGRLLVNGLSE